MADTDHWQTGRSSADTDYRPIIGAPLMIMTMWQGTSTSSITVCNMKRNEMRNWKYVIRMWTKDYRRCMDSVSADVRAIGHVSGRVQRGREWSVISPESTLSRRTAGSNGLDSARFCGGSDSTESSWADLCGIATTTCQCQCQSNIYIAPIIEGRIWGAGVWVTRRDRQKRKGEI